VAVWYCFFLKSIDFVTVEDRLYHIFGESYSAIKIKVISIGKSDGGFPLGVEAMFVIEADVKSASSHWRLRLPNAFPCFAWERENEKEKRISKKVSYSNEFEGCVSSLLNSDALGRLNLHNQQNFTNKMRLTHPKNLR
jgi:endo-beta-N-acetylglucosaminidase D